MKTEFQINIEYGYNGKRERKSYRFENADKRNETYQSVCSRLSENQVSMEHLRDNDGVSVSTYNYSDKDGNDLAQFIPQTYFRIEVLGEILEMIEQNAMMI